MLTTESIIMALCSAEDNFNQADMARIYAGITQEHGPSQQLINFINYDGKFGEEIGLESFESFSTMVQHEILLSKIKPDVMDAIALEGFLDFTKKFRSWLVAGGAAAVWLVPGSPLAVVGIASIISGAIGFVKTLDDAHVPKETYAANLRAVSVIALKSATLAVDHIPADLDPTKWDHYVTTILPQIAKLDEEFDEVSESDETKGSFDANFPASGWNVSKFVAATKWQVEMSKKTDALIKKSVVKIEVFEKLIEAKSKDPATAKAAKNALKIIKKATTSHSTLNYCVREHGEILNKVAKFVEVTGK